MARLNEPSVPTESIESLKKRFMRQNRDLARVNSTQSVRIRSLENEVSNLLAENLSLRETVSHYKLEAENGKTQQIAAHTTEVKLQLEARLTEITALIGSLGHPPRSKRSSESKGRISIAQNEQATGPRRWGTEQDHEGRLPPILEYKSYPRRTLEQELLEIIKNDEVNSTDSPEIGPPPVSQFVDEDPVKIDLPIKGRSQSGEEMGGMDPSLSMNLEQRRRRKDSGGPSENRRSSSNGFATQNLDSGPSLKTGAKRKLGVREDEEGTVVVDQLASTLQQPPGDSATSNPEVRSELRSAGVAKEISQNPLVNKDSLSSNQSVAVRKVLAPKSVNKSPKKQVRTSTADTIKPEKSGKPKAQYTDKERKEQRHEPVRLPLRERRIGMPDTIVLAAEPETEPETPAIMDVFSPPESLPSVAKMGSRDTPPPGDLSSNNDASRPSRRARGAVSYAEPNLRDKMRRPTKDLVDAVSGDAKNSLQSLTKQENSALLSQNIKPETEVDVDWKSMPAASCNTVENSPLRSKGLPLETLPESISTHRKRRESLLHHSDSDCTPSNAGNTIIALLAENRKAKAAVTSERIRGEKGVRMSQLDVSEFKDPSPPPTIKVATDNRVNTTSRRQSSVTQITHSPDDGNSSDLERGKKVDASSRRRQSSLGVNRSTSRPEISSREGTSDRLMKRPTSVVELSTASVSESRNERISARRRSMML